LEEFGGKFINERVGLSPLFDEWEEIDFSTFRIDGGRSCFFRLLTYFFGSRLNGFSPQTLIHFALISVEESSIRFLMSQLRGSQFRARALLVPTGIESVGENEEERKNKSKEIHQVFLSV
jgi:hypothetical protein